MTRLESEEIQQVIKEAFLSYDGPDVHVPVYLLGRTMDWNELQHHLAAQESPGQEPPGQEIPTQEIPTHPSEISDVIRKVEEHVRSAVTDYLTV